MVVDDAVGGFKWHEVEVVVDGGAAELKEVGHGVGHEVPAGAGVPAEAVEFEGPGAVAEVLVLFDEVDFISFA